MRETPTVVRGRDPDAERASKGRRPAARRSWATQQAHWRASEALVASVVSSWAPHDDVLLDASAPRPEMVDAFEDASVDPEVNVILSVSGK